jgi:hypothetical protein
VALPPSCTGRSIVYGVIILGLLLAYGHEEKER